MKDALQSKESYADYRLTRAQEITDAAKRSGVQLAGQIVLDLGCSDGAISPYYLEAGASEVIGVDIDAAAIDAAKRQHARPGLSFHLSDTDRLPLSDQSVNVIIAYDVFEHVAVPAALLEECHRVLTPGGQLLIGTWGWHHPFAPHLWSTMPVPWAHVFFSERTLLRTCRRVYHSDWYTPNMHDFDENGERIQDRYLNESIDTSYLNKFLVRDFERTFETSQLDWTLQPQPFSSPLASWTRLFLKTPWIREFFTAYFWAVLTRPEAVERRAERVEQRASDLQPVA
jgi:SAM-dependent methyltransferase